MKATDISAVHQLQLAPCDQQQQNLTGVEWNKGNLMKRLLVECKCFSPSPFMLLSHSLSTVVKMVAMIWSHFWLVSFFFEQICKVHTESSLKHLFKTKRVCGAFVRVAVCVMHLCVLQGVWRICVWLELIFSLLSTCWFSFKWIFFDRTFLFFWPHTLQQLVYSTVFTRWYNNCFCGSG